MATKPFDKDRGQDQDRNWFTRTAVQAAVFTGTAVGGYHLWKMTGPARKILEREADNTMKRIIERETLNSTDRFNDIANQYGSSIAERGKGLFNYDDIHASWDAEKNVNTDQALLTQIETMEEKIVRRIEEDASHLSGRPAEIKSARPTYGDPDWYAINKKRTAWKQKTVKLDGQTATELSKARYEALMEYYQTYGNVVDPQYAFGGETEFKPTELQGMSEYYSSNDFIKGGEIKDGAGKNTIARTTIMYESLKKDPKFASIYYRKVREIYRRYVLVSHASNRPKVEPNAAAHEPAGWRQFVFGNVIGNTLDPSEFKGYAPKVEDLFDSGDSRKAIREVTSMGATDWGKSNRFSILQQTRYTGHIENIRKKLETLKQSGHIRGYSVSIVDYGNASSPEKKLVLSLMHNTEISRLYNIEIPIGIDGRLPGATPGLQQVAERFHVVGDNYGFGSNKLGIINTTERLLIDVGRILDTSLVSGSRDSFVDDPDKAIKQINRSITQTISENAACVGSTYDLMAAMSIDNPALRDLIDNTRHRHASTLKTLHNYTATARNIKQVAKLRREGKKAVIINFDMETLDNTTASPGKALMSKQAQIVKTGIAVQDVTTGRIIHSSEKSNSTGLAYFDIAEGVRKGSGFNPNLEKWGRDGMGLQFQPGGMRDAYAAQLQAEKAAGNWDDATSRTQVVRNTANNIMELKRYYEKEGYEVFIGTKNGYDFDMIPFQQEAQDFFHIIKGSIIDSQAIGAYQNLALGENNALKLEQVLKTMMGRLGHSETDFLPNGRFDTKTSLGMKNIIDALNKAKMDSRNGNVFLAHYVMPKNGVITAHASPRTDAVLGAALSMMNVVDFENGHMPWLHDSDSVQNLLHKLTSGPISPENWMELFHTINNKTLEGFGVIGFSSASQGMISSLVASALHINEISPFVDPLNSGVRRRLAGMFNIGLNPYELKKSHAKDPSYLARRHLGKFMTTTTIEDATKVMHQRLNVPEAHDATNHFASSVMAKVLYTLEPEIEPYIAVTQGFANKFVTHNQMSMYSDTLKGDSLFNAKMLDFHRAVQQTLTKMGITGEPSKEQMELAQRAVSASQDWAIRLDSEVFSASNYGGSVKFPKRAIYGRIQSVEVDRANVGASKNSPPRLVAKINYALEGWDIFKAAQLQVAGVHGVAHAAEALADAQAFGALGAHDYDVIATSEFLKKGHTGAAKEAMLSGLLRKLYDDIETPKGGITREQKRASIHLLKKIKRELNATVSLKHNKFIRNTKEIGSSTDLAVKYAGDNDVRLAQLVGWYRDAGLVWNKEEMKDLYSQGFRPDVIKQYHNYFADIKALSDEELAAKHRALQDLTPEQFRTMRDDADSWMQIFNWDMNNPGSTLKMLGVAKKGSGWRVGFQAYQDITIYGGDLESAANKDNIFRIDYMMGLKHTFHGKNSSTMEFFAKHVFAARSEKLRSVVSTYKNFLNAMFAENLTRAPMSIDAIQHLTDLRQRIQLESKKHGMHGAQTWGDMTDDVLYKAQTDRQRLIESEEQLGSTDEVLKLKQEQEQIANVLNKRGRKGEHIFSNQGSRFNKLYTQADIDAFGDLAKANNGVMAFNLPSFKGASTHTIQIEETMRSQLMKIMGEHSLSEFEVGSLTNKLVQTLSDHADITKKGNQAPIRFDKESGKLHLGALIMDWDPTPGNMFTPVSQGLYKATEQTQIKIDMLDALRSWQEVATKLNQNGKPLSDAEHQFMTNSSDRFNRMYLRYLMMGLPADKMSEFWRAGQYAPKALYLMHKNVYTLQQNVMGLEQTKPGAFKKHAAAIKNLKTMSMDTMVITEEQLREYNFVDQKTGESINAVRHLEEKLGKDWESIRKGERYLPGGVFIRHPVPQAGYDGLHTGQFLVLPKELAKMAGADENTVYGHPVYGAAQAADTDGDHYFIHLKEFATIQQAENVRAEDLRTLNDMLDSNTKLTEDIMNSKILDGSDSVKIGTINSIIGYEGNKAHVSSLEIIGEGKNRQVISTLKTVETSRLDFTNGVEHMIGMLKNMASGGSAGGMTQRQTNAMMNSYSSTLIAKHLIPLTTNLLKTRVHELLATNPNPNAEWGAWFTSTVGNLTHGLAGMAQGVIDAAKNPEKAQSLSKMYNWLRDPTRDKAAGQSAWLDMERVQYGDRFDEEQATARFMEMHNKFVDMHIMRKNSPEFKTQNDSSNDFMMGRKTSNVFDYYTSITNNLFEIFAPDKPSTIMGELNNALSNKLGRQVDATPVFRKAGKWGAIGAAVFMGLGLFTPMGNSNSLNPIDMFTDLGTIGGDTASMSSSLELPRNVPLNMVDASFSKQAFIRMNKGNNKKQRSNAINDLLMGSILSRGDSIYEFEDKPYKTYSNYTRNISKFGSSDLKRRTSQNERNRG